MLRPGQPPAERAEWPTPSRFGRTPQGSALLRMALMRRSGNIVEPPLDEHLRSILPHGPARGPPDERTDLEVPLTSLRELACEYRYSKAPTCLPKSRLSRSTPLKKRGRGSCPEFDDMEARYCQRVRFEVDCKVPYVGEGDCILGDTFSDMNGIDSLLGEPDDAVVPEKRQHFMAVDCSFYSWQVTMNNCVPIEMEA
eukprot:CAMPEP_0118934808 /NCGR_PEP_ID=MMETSP1169-20130426/14192_1 /TAXON_ID=36882 /ORGANISM="Pyramimonas obovata, Strain CCMP722" /LENGTH=196 /DNA_ID=CAMNT_0006877745 /DNA_START=389 /DNA_END=979 /DNA_ORIENTATION=+